MTTLAALYSLIAQGESETLELKRSIAALKRPGDTLRALLNTDRGKVLIGVGLEGKLVAHTNADLTLRGIAAMLGPFEPPARVELRRVGVESGRQVIALEAATGIRAALVTQEHRPRARDLAPGGHQGGTSSEASSSARTCRRSARASRAHAPLGPNRPKHVPRPGCGSAARGPAPRDEHHRRAAEARRSSATRRTPAAPASRSRDAHEGERS